MGSLSAGDAAQARSTISNLKNLLDALEQKLAN
jgi:hypothetical protein